MVPRPLSRRPLVLAAFSAALAAASMRGQTHKVDAPEKVTRAIGVYEWTGDLAKPSAARLIPVSLFINNQLEDAGVYLARPVPFALQAGDVYEIERAGEPEGTLDISYARDIVTRRSVADDDPLGAWYGYGTFMTPQQEAKLAKLKPSAKLPVIASSLGDDDAAPHFVYRKPAGSGGGSGGTSGSKGGSTGSAQSTPAPNPAPDDDPDRPTLRHRDPATTNSGKPKKARDEGYVTPPNNSLNDDPDRPTMRRGIPENQVAIQQLTGIPPNMHQTAAVSDAADNDDHPFARPWATSTERAETLAAIEQIAQPRVASYLAENQMTPAAASLATPANGPVLQTGPVRHSGPVLHSNHSGLGASGSASSRTSGAAAKKKAAAAPVAVLLTNEKMDGYTLSYGGLPTFIYTAESPVAKDGPVYITMVVQRLPAGELQVALSSVTDAAHLDRVPWMRPVDVVDVDWSHRASLLFEMRAQTSRQFALYRLTSARAEQTFITGVIE